MIKSIVKKFGNGLMVPVKMKDGFKVGQAVYVSLEQPEVKQEIPHA